MQEARAATIIQARVRGNRWRRQWWRCLRGVTKLQARQRGRYSRREYELLRQLYRDQEAFQLETKRRELRIWRNEQELYFLRHTTSEALARIRDFQQRRSARLIQRQWLQSHQADATKRATQRVIDPRDRVLTFDPFLLSRTGDATSRTSDKPKVNLLGPLPSTANVGAVPAVNSEEFAARRLAIQERVKAKMKAKKAAEAAALLKQNFRDAASARTNTNKALSRRELCDTLRNLNAHTANRLAEHKASYREQQATKARAQSELLASCNNRLAHLLAEKPPSASANAPDIDAASMDRWDPSRKRQAWEQHRAVVDSVVKKQRWWETYVAGQMRDIRKTYALSPWEPGQKVWAWPPRPGDVDPVISSDSQAFESEGIRMFLFGEVTAPEPLDDREVSLWWRAHCTQSHLTKENASRAANSVEEAAIKRTPEQLANPLLFRLMADTKLRRREQELEHEIAQRVGRFDKRVQRGVNEIEMQIEVNTKLEQDLEQRKRDRIARKTREQAAAIAIQRHARGRRGRVKARETRAEFFVMVRGRAIRKGRCEECGEQRAVLECSECQDSTHFCPVCWVHVHSTRRRKTHVAMPMIMPVSSVPPTTPSATNLMKSEPSVTRSETTSQDVAGRTMMGSGAAVRQKAKTAVPLRRSRLVDPEVQPLAPLLLEQTAPPTEAGSGGSVERAGIVPVAEVSRVVNDAGKGGALTRVVMKRPPPTKGDAAADQVELKPRSTADSTEAPLSPPSASAVVPVAPDAAEGIAAPIAHAQAGEGKGDAVETAQSEAVTLVTVATGDTVTSPPSKVASKSVRIKEGDVSSAPGEVQPIPRSDTESTGAPVAESAGVIVPDSAEGSQNKDATAAVTTTTVPLAPEPASSATGAVVSTGKKKPPPAKTAGRVSLKDRMKTGAVAKTSTTPAVDEQTAEATGAATGDASGGTGVETAEPAG